MLECICEKSGEVARKLRRNHDVCLLQVKHVTYTLCGLCPTRRECPAMAQSLIPSGETVVILLPSDRDEDAAVADAELETVIGVEGAPAELGVGGMKLPCGDAAAGPADPLAIEELCAAAACCG